MMYSFLSPGFQSGVIWFHAHMFFGALALVGFILLTVWAIKNLNKESLKSACLWLLAIGIIGTLLTAPMAAVGFKSMFGGWFSGGFMHDQSSMQQMYNLMDEHNAEEADDDHEFMEEMMRDMMRYR